MPQPIQATPLYASDFPPRARVADIVGRLRRKGYLVVYVDLQLCAIRMH